MIVPAAVGGFLLGQREDDGSAGPEIVSSGRLELEMPPGWKRMSTSLAASHRLSIRALGESPAPPQAEGAKRDVVAALGRIERGYRDLASAIRRGDSRTFTAARTAIGNEDARLRRLLATIS